MSEKNFKLLFVCMGNICRSPAAEGVMLHKVREAGLANRIEIDSAGTGGWHAGDAPDSRMRKHAQQRGYALDSVARQVRMQDFTDFDLILVMDQQNLREIRPFASDPSLMKKVRLFCEFAEDREEIEVPDPYYGGEAGFEQVLDIVENGCDHLLAHIQRELHA
ncbi:MAG: low molecular weight phosphotyrosine protein phosphatase [Verrucomicrobiaceae bacterium]|nr:low molecular weight phosphotyrosine protein phosphatase [Verrucomicrobiaceae bacterium]